MWWDTVVRVNAAEPGKTHGGALSRHDSVVCFGILSPNSRLQYGGDVVVRVNVAEHGMATRCVCMGTCTIRRIFVCVTYCVCLEVQCAHTSLVSPR